MSSAGTPERRAVWYGCYGSNLSIARFRCYLAGGTPPGSARGQPGCRDATPPTGNRAVTLPGRVHLAQHSPAWDGAVAFLDTAAPGRSPGRAYRITVEQVADVVAQENGRPPGSVTVDLGDLVTRGREEVCPGWYGTLAHVGAVDGEPLFTITSSWTLDDIEVAPPSAAYIRTMGAGLAEAHGWSTEEVAAHLLQCPGVAPTWSIDAVAEALRD